MTLIELQLNSGAALDSYVNPRMVLPTMAYTGRLCPKGVPAFYGTISKLIEGILMGYKKVRGWSGQSLKLC